MTKSVKGSLLTTEGASSSGTGSRSLGQTHQVTEDQFDKFRAKGLAASVNKYLVRFLVDYNFANVDGYPRFAFDDEEEEDMVNASKVVLQLRQAFPNYDMDMEQISDKFGYQFTQKPVDVTPPAVPPQTSEDDGIDE